MVLVTVLTSSRTHHISSVHALNGYMFIGGNRVLESDSSHTGWDLNFISEVMHEYLVFQLLLLDHLNGH